MALSNIFNEPRRELTEQAIGFVALAGLAIADLAVASILMLIADGSIHQRWEEFLFAMAIGLPVIFLIVLLFLAIHSLGEAICNVLARSNMDPRPTRGR